MTLSRALGSLGLLALVGLVFTLAQAWVSGVDREEHESYAYALRRATELDARLDQEVANSRLGLVTHYDGIVRVWDHLRQNRASLEQAPRYVGAADRASLLALVESYAEALTAKRNLVERFKSEQAVLRNSLRALPHNAERVVVELRARPDGGGVLVADVEGLVAAVLRQVVVPSEANDRVARARVAQVEAATVDGDPALTARIRVVARHARVVLERQAAVTTVVREIMALDVSSSAARALLRYRSIHEGASARERGWWVSGLICGVALLLFGAAFVIARLRHERDREAELARLKSRFVSMTSHEFRTPLSVILSSAELLEAYGEKWGADKRAKHLGRIQEGAHAMTTMLDQVLLIGRAEAGMLELNPARVRLSDLADAVVEEVRAAVGADRALDMSIEGSTEEATVDERLLRHVLTNLLSNAFKYSPEDSTVRFAIRAGEHAATFEVEDEGIGIPAAERGQLFDAFHRCSNAEAIPGTGLGLAVVRRSVEVHGGSIEVTSEVGRGTTFSVRVPYLGGGAG